MNGIILFMIAKFKSCGIGTLCKFGIKFNFNSNITRSCWMYTYKTKMLRVYMYYNQI